jgi:hypothetical protein
MMTREIVACPTGPKLRIIWADSTTAKLRVRVMENCSGESFNRTVVTLAERKTCTDDDGS